MQIKDLTKILKAYVRPFYAKLKYKYILYIIYYSVEWKYKTNFEYFYMYLQVYIQMKKTAIRLNNERFLLNCGFFKRKPNPSFYLVVIKSPKTRIEVWGVFFSANPNMDGRLGSLL